MQVDGLEWHVRSKDVRSVSWFVFFFQAEDGIRDIGVTGVQTCALPISIAFWAVPGPGLADEETPLAFDASPAVAADARVVTEIEHRLLGNPNIEGIALRYGFFYGPGTWFSPDGDVAQQVRQQQFPIVGNGEGVWSWLHIKDAAIATVAAAERGNPGIYLIANDRPLAVRQWLPAFAQWLNAPPPPQISVEDALKASGADAVYYGTQMRGVSNAKAKR